MMSPKFTVLWAASGFTPTHPDAVQEMASEKANRLPAKTHRVVQIGPGVAVKYGMLVSKKEAENMMVMAKNTSIPVPKVLAYGTFGPFARSARDNVICDGQFYETYIYMVLAKGQSLEKAWDSCTISSRQAISKQLTRYLQELRKLEGSYIGSLNGGAVLDMASPSIKSKGPFKSEGQFNTALSNAYITTLGTSGLDIQTFVRELLSNNDHKIHFTHGNIKPRHIMVHNGRVTAILDWALSGFYPEYWDFAKAIDGDELGDERAVFIMNTFPQQYALEYLVYCFLTEVL